MRRINLWKYTKFKQELRNDEKVSETMHRLGFKSCKYTPPTKFDRYNIEWWELSEEEYTWFILRWA